MYTKMNVCITMATLLHTDFILTAIIMTILEDGSIPKLWASLSQYFCKKILIIVSVKSVMDQVLPKLPICITRRNIILAVVLKRLFARLLSLEK